MFYNISARPVNEEFRTAHEARLAKKEHKRRSHPKGDGTPTTAEENFNRIDADGDGIITKSEFVSNSPYYKNPVTGIGLTANRLLDSMLANCKMH